MARTKKLSNYGSEWPQLVEACAVQGRVIEVTARDRSDAWRIQGRFYAWRKALDGAALDAELRPEGKTQQKLYWLRDVVSWAAKTACHFNQAMPPDQPRVVRFSSVDNTEMSQMLRAALAQSQPAAAGSRAAEESLARVQASLDQVQPHAPEPGPLAPPKKYY